MLLPSHRRPLLEPSLPPAGGLIQRESFEALSSRWLQQQSRFGRVRQIFREEALDIGRRLERSKEEEEDVARPADLANSPRSEFGRRRGKKFLDESALLLARSSKSGAAAASKQQH